MIKLELPCGEATAERVDQYCADSLSSFISASNEPGKSRLQALDAQLRARYSRYNEAKGDPSRVGPTPFPKGLAPPADHGDFLYACYKRSRTSLEAVFESIRRSNAGACPYCGLRLRMKPRDRAYDSDHYLPRSVFPEFSIHPLNLVECCDDCNEAKRSDYVDAQGLPLFLHPYFARCFRQRLLHATVTSAAGIPRVEFSLQLAALTPSEQSWVVRHVTSLDVLPRLEDDVTPELQMTIKSSARRPIADTRVLLLAIAAEGLQARPNCPRHVAIEGLAASVDLPNLIVAAEHALDLLSA